MILPGGSILFFLKTWWKYSLQWQFANLLAEMVTSQSPISSNCKHWYHNIGRHQCCPGDVLREKDCRKLALGQLLSAEATTDSMYGTRNGQVLRTIKILLELPSFLQIITIIIQTTIVYYSKKLHHHLQ